jgi:putative spermidine/putrescine transport system substrate-binding protein
VIAAALVAGVAHANKTALSKPATVAKPAAVPNLHGVTLTVANFGGDLAVAERKAWEIPFQKLTGAKIRDDLVDYAKLKAQVQSGNVSWDVVEADTFFVEQQCNKLFLLRSAAIKKVLKNALPGSITNKCGIPVVGSATVLAYDPAKFASDPPKNWKDFFNTEKYPGKRAVWNYVLNGLPEAALLADGVSPKHLYPLDMNRAFKKLETIKSDLVFYDTLAEEQNAIASGQVVMANVFTGRLVGAVTAGSKFKAVWNQNFRIWDNFAVPKGSKNVAAAMYYLQYMMNPKVQNRLTKYISYTSMLKGPAPKTDPLTAQYLATTPSHYKAGIAVNEHWWAQNYDTMNQRWTNFTSG